MPIWVIILLISLCVTTVTGVYTLRQNGRNGHRNGNGNGHTISQMTHSSEQSLSGEPPSQEKKTLTLSVLKVMIVEEESPHETVTKWNQSKNNGALPDEEPHDHSEDHSPDPVLRERRRMVVRPREDEEESGDELLQPELSAAPESLPAPIEDQRQLNKIMTLETGIQEEWQHDEDVVDTLMITKDAETQTPVFQEDKGIEARPEMQDQEMQNSPVKESLPPQTLLSTEEKGIGEPLETENKGIQVSPDQEDKSLQENPQRHSIGTGKEQALQRSVGDPCPRFQDRSLQVTPDAMDQSVQESPDYYSIGVGTDERALRDQSLQTLSVAPIMKSVATNTSEEEPHPPMTIGDLLRMMGADRLQSIQGEDVESQRPVFSRPRTSHLYPWDDQETIKSESVSSSRKSSVDGIGDREEPLLQSFVPSITPSPWLMELQQEESLILDSPQSVPRRQRSFHLSDLPLDESKGESPRSVRKSQSRSWTILDSDEEWSLIHSRSLFQTVKSEEMEEYLR